MGKLRCGLGQGEVGIPLGCFDELWGAEQWGEFIECNRNCEFSTTRFLTVMSDVLTQ
jgi:hypothetical protein